jgi:hypothetical protein
MGAIEITHGTCRPTAVAVAAVAPTAAGVVGSIALLISASIEFY